MTWSYDPAAVATNPVYQIRFELQDTDQSEMLLQDEEITYLLQIESGLLQASARGAEVIARLFARQADSVQNPTVKLEFKSRVRAYKDLALTLRKRASASHVPIIVSASSATKQAAYDNTDRTGPYFRVGMQGQDDTGSNATPFQRGEGPLYR